MSKQRTVPVTARAMTQRINRRLIAEDEQLKATRGERQRDEVGDLYVLSTFHNLIVRTRVDVGALAMEMGVIRAWDLR